MPDFFFFFSIQNCLLRSKKVCSAQRSITPPPAPPPIKERCGQTLSLLQSLRCRLGRDDEVELDEAHPEALRHQRHHQRALDRRPECLFVFAGHGVVLGGGSRAAANGRPSCPNLHKKNRAHTEARHTTKHHTHQPARSRPSTPSAVSADLMTAPQNGATSADQSAVRTPVMPSASVCLFSVCGCWVGCVLIVFVWVGCGGRQSKPPPHTHPTQHNKHSTPQPSLPHDAPNKRR